MVGVSSVWLKRLDNRATIVQYSTRERKYRAYSAHFARYFLAQL